jgi:hypothetical protein
MTPALFVEFLFEALRRSKLQHASHLTIAVAPTETRQHLELAQDRAEAHARARAEAAAKVQNQAKELTPTVCVGCEAIKGSLGHSVAEQRP